MSFWDASALVPLCVNEAVSSSARRLWKDGSVHVVRCETVVEMASALARLGREAVIDESNLATAEQILETLEKSWTIVEFDFRVIDLARIFPALYGLKAGDSIQLAAALVWCKEFPKNKDFVSADTRLSKAAETAGFTVHYLI